MRNENPYPPGSTDEARGARPPASATGEAAETSALVPEGGVWDGQVAVIGKTLIEGKVNGTLRGPGELVIGRSGVVEGLIECEVVETHGQVIGPVVAHEKASLGAGTRLDGDLDTPALEVDEAAIWNGVARVGD